MLTRNQPDPARFNRSLPLPFNLRNADFELAMQDVYDFFFDVNTLLLAKGLERLDDMLRPAIMSGVISDMLTASLAKHSRSLVQSRFFQRPPGPGCEGSISRQRRQRGRGRSRSQDHAESGRGGRHAWGAGPVDVSIRLQHRRSDRAGHQPRSHDVHRSLPGSGDPGRFSP